MNVCGLDSSAWVTAGTGPGRLPGAFGLPGGRGLPTFPRLTWILPWPSRGSPRQFKDYRQLLDMKELDAVVISTPDHWHALQTIHACQPARMSTSKNHCRSASRKDAAWWKRCAGISGSARSASTGARSMSAARQRIRPARRAWKNHGARAFHIQNEWPSGIGTPPDGNPPADFDWEAWLGSARSGPTIKIALSTVSDGSTITAADRSPISGALHRFHPVGARAEARSPSPPWAPSLRDEG